MLAANQEKLETRSSNQPQDNEIQSPKSVLIFANFGLYHIARLNALKEVCSTTGIEFAGSQKFYGWTVEKNQTGISTLYSGALEEMSWRDLIISCRDLWTLLQRTKASHLFIPGYADLRCIVAAFWARAKGAQPILMYETTELDKPRNAVIELAKGIIIKALFSHSFVGGARSAAYLQKLKFPAQRIIQKYDVVDNDFFHNGTNELRRSGQRKDWELPDNYFLFVARLAPEKNASTLISAFEEYRKHGGAWDLVLVGRGAEEQQLRLLAQNKQLDGIVHFRGFKNAEELWPFYAFANCFVLPSTREPWGLVVNEAMASGLPVIVSNACGCAPDLVKEARNGYTFDPRDPGQLSMLLSRMSKLPSEERSKMGQASCEIVANYSPENWGQSAATLIKSATSSSAQKHKRK